MGSNSIKVAWPSLRRKLWVPLCFLKRHPLVISVVRPTVTPHAASLREGSPVVHFSGLLLLPRTLHRMTVISGIVTMLSCMPRGNLRLKSSDLSEYYNGGFGWVFNTGPPCFLRVRRSMTSANSRPWYSALSSTRLRVVICVLSIFGWLDKCCFHISSGICVYR